MILADLQRTVLDGSLLLAVPIAMAAGLLSFLSPCVLPLVPGYLGYVTGLTGRGLEDQRRAPMVAGIGLFVMGFTAVYVAMGWAAGGLGSLLLEHRTALTRVLGAVTVLMGLLYLEVIPGTFAGRVTAFRPAAGLAGAPLLGAVFGLSWTACTGPTLAVIAGMATLGGDAGRGALLATAYCLGLGIPFLLAGLAYRRVMGVLASVRGHARTVTRIGGGLLLVVGVLLVTGVWDDWVTSLQGLIAGVEAPL